MINKNIQKCLIIYQKLMSFLREELVMLVKVSMSKHPFPSVERYYDREYYPNILRWSFSESNLFLLSHIHFRLAVTDRCM